MGFASLYPSYRFSLQAGGVLSSNPLMGFALLYPSYRFSLQAAGN